LSSSKKGGKRRFTAGFAFVSASWDQPASVHINFKKKNAGEWPKLNGFTSDIFLLVRSKRSGEWRLFAAFCRRLKWGQLFFYIGRKFRSASLKKSGFYLKPFTFYSHMSVLGWSAKVAAKGGSPPLFVGVLEWGQWFV
jgi:hypothetical protein